MVSHEPILISGAARSGTSLIAGIIIKCGAWGGNMRGHSRWNPKGQFENEKIRHNVVKPYIKSMGYDPMCQKPLPDINNLQPFDMRSRVLDVMVSQGYTNGHWMYKGPKMCLIWPVWKEAFPDAKWIIVRRETEDIVNSCMRTSFMHAYKHPDGWRMWVAEHEKRFEEMKDADLDVREVWPIKAIQGDFTEVKEMVLDCGLQWNESAVKDFVSPELYHSK